MSLRTAIFCHSLLSDWNHGNAHFLRGIVAEMQARGHSVTVFEPADSWSLRNLLDDHGQAAIDDFRRVFPHLTSIAYDPRELPIAEWLEGCDLVLVHEWNEPRLISAIGRYRAENPGIRLFFHDTHHRAVTAPEQLAAFDLSQYDGVLAYGASLKEAYLRRGWGAQVHVWHEAADTRVFYPLEQVENDAEKTTDLVWIGNWGDGERSEELREYWIEPCARLRLRASAFGVRYPASALEELAAAGIRHGGWLANHRAPEMFARSRVTIHVPRRPYTRQLLGIPTIRPFEALACGIPLVSAPWNDSEDLFRVGKDFLMARNGSEMQRQIAGVLADPDLAASLRRSGLETILGRHTCAHRVDELMTIYEARKPAARVEKRLEVVEEVHS